MSFAGVRIAATVDSSTPSASPRQPACAAAISEPWRSANTTGRQSAVRMASTVPVVAVTDASASGSSTLPPSLRPSPTSGRAKSTRATSMPCTCRNQCGGEGSCNAASSCRRFSITASGSSPQRDPRLKASNGACETPSPRRVLVSARTPGGARQSASSQALIGAGAPLPHARRHPRAAVSSTAACPRAPARCGGSARP